MPRATQSAGSTVVDFFRKAPLELADFVMGLAKDALRERHQKSADAKARATESATPVKAKTAHKAKGPKPKPAAAAKVKTAKAKVKAKAKGAGVKKSHHKKVAAPAAQTGTGAVGNVEHFPEPGSAEDTVGPTVSESELAGASV